MKNLIVIQTQIDKDIVDGKNRTIGVSNVIRQIEAESIEIAIGKFVIATRQIKALTKLNIECYDLAELLSVD